MDGIDVENTITRDRIRAALSRYENKPGDSFENGTVRTVNSDGSYEVLLDGDVQPRTCSAYATAGVGDRVLVCIMANGRCVAVARLEGEWVEFAKPVDMHKALSVGGDLVVKGSRFYSKPAIFHRTSGQSGVEGYVKICSVRHLAAYKNTGMSLAISQRHRRTSIIHIVPMNSAETDFPAVSVFSVDGLANVYGVRSGQNLDVYVQKSEAWDDVALVDAWSNNDYMGDWLDTTTGFVTTLPSGYITADREDYAVSEGTSGNWHYWKFADGWAICSGYKEVWISGWTEWANGVHYSNEEISMTYPFTFVSRPTEVAFFGSDSYGNSAWLYTRYPNTTTTTHTVRPTRPNSGATQTIRINFLTIGRWR